MRKTSTQKTKLPKLLPILQKGNMAVSVAIEKLQHFRAKHPLRDERFLAYQQRASLKD